MKPSLLILGLSAVFVVGVVAVLGFATFSNDDVDKEIPVKSKMQENILHDSYKINTECEFIHFINEPESMPKLIDFISANPEIHQQKYFELGGPMTDDDASIAKKDRVTRLVAADHMLNIFSINPDLEGFIVEILDESNAKKLVERIRDTDPECELPEFIGKQRFADPPAKPITLGLKDISVSQTLMKTTVEIKLKIDNPNYRSVIVPYLTYQLFEDENDLGVSGQIGSELESSADSSYYTILGESSLVLTDVVVLNNEKLPFLLGDELKVIGDISYYFDRDEENKIHFELTK